MTDERNTEKAKVWLKPDQVDRLRDACHEVGAPYLQQRNEALILVMYDAGTRVDETVSIEVDNLRENLKKLYLPAHKQKQYPTENSSPDATTIRFHLDTHRVLNTYLTTRWKDSPYLFPSRQSDRMTTESARNVVRRVAKAADVRPYKVDGTRGQPEDVTPHALRHSVAYRMLNTEDGYSMYDVRNRLRHRSITTTERVYDHIDEV